MTSLNTAIPIASNFNEIALENRLGFLKIMGEITPPFSGGVID